MATTPTTITTTPSNFERNYVKGKQDASPQIVTEPELRAFTRCSEFHFRGGRTELPLKTGVIEYTYIRMVLDILRNPHFDYHFELNKILQGARRHLDLGTLPDQDIDELMRSAALGVDEIFRILPPHLYIPIFGVFEYPVQVSDSIVTMKVSSILATKRNLNDPSVNKIDPDYRTKTIHAVTFSPFTNSRDMETDLVQQVKALTLGAANPTRLNKDRVKVRLHIFSARDRVVGVSHVNYTFVEHRTPINTKEWANYLEQPVKLLEQGYHYPLAPCLYQCPFRANCFPDPFIKSGAPT